MLTWAVLFICDLLIPLTMLIFGVVFIKRPPSEINDYYGYRTPRSMSSEAAWSFAHRYFGRLWAILGALMLVPTALGVIALLPLGENELSLFGLLICLVQCFVMLIPIVPTELALKKHFGLR